MTGQGRDLFRAVVAETLGVAPGNVALFARGRVAFYALLRALGVGPDDEVIVPAFTCVAVPNAIMYTGARPVWVDIDPATFCVDPAAVERALGPRTRVVLAQNTFGLSADLDAITGIATDRGIAVIDDCTHGLGGRYHGRPNGVTAPFAFFSTQWSKPISTGLGGFAVDREGVLGSLRWLESAAAEPSAMERVALRALVRGRSVAGSGWLFRKGREVYRRVGRRGIVPGSSNQDELDGTIPPARFLSRLSDWQARLGGERLQGLGVVTARRAEVAHRYTDWLRAHDRTPAVEPPGIEHAFLRYPLRVRDRDRFVATAERAGVDLGDWFLSPVHPVIERLERWDYVVGTAPHAEQACREIVNLPTDADDQEVGRILALLSASRDLIL